MARQRMPSASELSSVVDQGSAESALQLMLIADRRVAAQVRQLLPALVSGVIEIDVDSSKEQQQLRELGFATSFPERRLAIGFVAGPGEGDGLAPPLTRVIELFPEALREEALFRTENGAVDAGGLDRWCARRLRAVLDHLLADYARAQLANAALRRTVEEMEASLSVAEAAYVDFGREPLKLAFRTEPNGLYALGPSKPEDDNPGPHRLDQRIWQRIGGLRYVDLYFSRHGGSPTAAISLRVKGAISGRVFCERTIPSTRIAGGWNQFECRRLPPGQPEPLDLELELPDPADCYSAPALSHPNLNPERCAHVDGQSTGRALALQLWSGIAGMDWPRHAEAIARDDLPTEAEETLSVGPGFLERATLFSTLPPEVSFTPVAFEAARQWLLVHPLGRTPTIAVLPPLEVQNLRAVSSVIQLRNPAAQPTEFAIAVLPPSARQADFASEQRLAELEWHLLRAGEWGEIELALAAPLSGAVTLCLLTRNVSEQYNLSWAYFRGIRLACAPASGEPVGPRA